MIALKNNNAGGKLRHVQQQIAPNQPQIKPCIKNATRWTSVFNVVVNYIKLKPFLAPDEWPELQQKNLLLTAAENLDVDSMFDRMKDFESVSKTLQSPSVTIADIRGIFDQIITKYPEMEHYLKSDANIVHKAKFDSAIVKVQNKQENLLDVEESIAIQCLLKPPVIDVDEVTDEAASFGEKALRASKQRRENIQVSLYINTQGIQGTSNCCERLFSIAKLTFSSRRQSMLPKNLEGVLFLRYNKDLWNYAEVASAFEA